MDKLQIKGFTYGSIAAASYGLNPLFALPLYQSGLTVDTVLFYRYGFAILMLALLMKVKHIPFGIKRCELRPLALLGLLFSASSLCLFESYNYMDAGIASTILFVYPVMVAVIMAVVYKEKVSVLTMVSIAMAIWGISLLSKGGDGKPLSLIGFLFVILSSLSYAIYIVGVNRSKVGAMPSAKLTFYALVFGILIYVVRLHGCTDLQPLTTPLTWTCALCLALFPTIISLITMALSIRYIGSTPAAILGALEPVTALVVGVIVFGEQLTPRILLGIFMVLLAVTLIVASKSIYRWIAAMRRSKNRE